MGYPAFHIWKAGGPLLLPIGALAAAFSDGFPGVMALSFLPWGAVPLLVFAAWGACKGSVWVAICAGLAALVAVLPLFRVPEPACQGAKDEHVGRVAHMNVHEANNRYDAVISAALLIRADILSIQEVDSIWLEKLEQGLAREYPWHLHGPGERNYGIALFSRIPFDRVEVLDLDGLPAIQALVTFDSVSLRVIAAHLRSPVSSPDWKQRNRQWSTLANLVTSSNTPTCLLGDLNTVPWDNAFVQFVATTGMHTGAGVLAPTWPAFTGFALIPLDHILLSKGCAMDAKETLTIPGSDHLGFVTRIRHCNAAKVICQVTRDFSNFAPRPDDVVVQD